MGGMIARLNISLIVLVLGANIPLFAQHMNERDSPCAGVAVTVDLVNCLAKARDAAEVKLNTVYQSVRGRLDTREVQQLTTAERLWIQYRDANCVAERDLYGGGSASGPSYLACLEAMTRKRATELTITYAVRLK